MLSNIEQLSNIQHKENEEIKYNKVYEINNISNKEIQEENYLINNTLITNSDKGNLLNELKKCLEKCEKFYFNVAFINFSGLQLLLDSFKQLEEKNIKGKIITSTYLNFTEPKALKRIKEFTNIELKIFIADKEKGFHTKAYIFENKNQYKIIIGSSNITQRALKSNIEWNVKVVPKKDNKFTYNVIEEYLKLWNTTAFVDNEFLEKYNKFIEEIKSIETEKSIQFDAYEIIKPNYIYAKESN